MSKFDVDKLRAIAKPLSDEERAEHRKVMDERRKMLREISRAEQRALEAYWAKKYFELEIQLKKYEPFATSNLNPIKEDE